MKRYSIRRKFTALLCAALLCAPLSALAQDVATDDEATKNVETLEPEDGTQPEESVKQFAVQLTPGEETLEIKITGASERSIMVGVYDSGLQYAAGDTVTGNDTLTYDLAAGDYYVLVEYDPPVDGIDVFEGEVTVPAKAAPSPDGGDTTTPDGGDTTTPDGGNTTTPDGGDTTTPDGGDTTTQTPFTVSLVGGEETLDVTIYGASSHILTINVCDASGSSVRKTKVEGSQKVTIDDLPAGNYSVKVEYSPSLNGVGTVEGYVTVKPKAAATPTPTPSAPAQNHSQIMATVKAGKDSISIQIVKGDNLPMIVSVGKQTAAAALGQTVEFKNLSKGTYEIEISYKDAASGAASYRTTVKVPLEVPDSYILLKKGMRCQEVYLLTQRLELLGYPITARYEYDSDVVIAVRLFQEENKLTVDGMAGKNTQTRLYSSSAKVYDIKNSYETLDRHDNGKAAVYALQQRLKDLGYYTIRVDGIYGSGTERAVRWFQKVHGLKETGKADAETQRVLYSASAKKASGSYIPDSSNYQTLSRSKYYNSKVVPLQRRLKELGYLSGSVDGYFGSQTYRAVRNFQSRNGLSVTGIADATTQALLYSSSAKAASGASASTSTGYRLLYWGCEGAAVTRLQNALIDAGYKSIVRVADGIYGQWTYDAVRAYQKDHALAVDGIAGKNTQNALYGTSY